MAALILAFSILQTDVRQRSHVNVMLEQVRSNVAKGRYNLAAKDEEGFRC